MTLPRRPWPFVALFALVFPSSRDAAARPVRPAVNGDHRPPAAVPAEPLPLGAVGRIGSVRFQHDSKVRQLAYSADGKLLASLGGDDRVSLWDTATGRERARYRAREGTRSMALSPDGRLLALTVGEGPIQIRETATGRERRPLGPMSLTTTLLLFSPDARTLAAVEKLGTEETHRVRLWNAATGKELAPFPEVREAISTLAFSADGRRLATAEDGASIRVWEVPTRRLLHQPGGAAGTVSSLAFSPDGKLLAAGTYRQLIHVWDAATGKEIRRLVEHDEFVSNVAFTPDGKRLVSRDGNGVVLVWNVATGKSLRHMEAHAPEQCLRAFGVSPDGRTLAVGGRLRFLDLETGRESLAREPGGGVVAFGPGGLLLTGETGLVAWDTAAARERRRFLLDDQETIRACTSAGRKEVAAVTTGGTIYRWDVATGRRRKIDADASGASVAFSPDGTLLAVGNNNNTISLHDPASGEEVRTLRLGEQAMGRRRRFGHTVAALAFSPDGKVLATSAEPFVRGRRWRETTTRESFLVLWDVTEGRELRRLVPGPAPLSGRVQCLAYSPDGKFLAVVAAEPRVRLWEIATAREVFSFPLLPGPVHGLAFSPDGRLLATAGDEPVTRVWSPATGHPVRRLGGHRDAVVAVGFAPDGRRLASASRDGTTLVWDATLLRPAPGENLSAADLEKLWAELGGADAVKAYRALGRLAAAPRQAVPFLRRRLRPAAPPADLARAAALIADLDNERFKVRDQATHALEKLGRWAAPALRAALEAGPTPEPRLRLERLLARVQNADPTPQELRFSRAVVVLEQDPGSEGRRVLEGLAAGAVAALETQDAKAALGRLARRLGPRP